MDTVGDLLGKFIRLAQGLLGRELLQEPLATLNLKGKGSNMDSMKTGYSRAKLDRAFKSNRKNKSAGNVGAISGIENFVARPGYPPK